MTEQLSHLAVLKKVPQPEAIDTVFAVLTKDSHSLSSRTHTFTADETIAKQFPASIERHPGKIAVKGMAYHVAEN